MLISRLPSEAYEAKKINELLNKLDDSLCEQIALDISTKSQTRFLNLKSLLDFVKKALILNAHFMAKRTEIINVKMVSNYEQQQILSAFYFKKSLKKLPKWAQKAILENDNDK